jgi:hypothetical protein
MKFIFGYLKYEQNQEVGSYKLQALLTSYFLLPASTSYKPNDCVYDC